MRNFVTKAAVGLLAAGSGAALAQLLTTQGPAADSTLTSSLDNSSSTPPETGTFAIAPTPTASFLSSNSLYAPSAECHYVNKYCDAIGDPLFNGFNYFDVVTRNWPDDPRGCVLGVLDNVRGQTSGAEGGNWKCDPPGPNQTMRRMSFTVSTVYLNAGTRVADAIKLASPGGSVDVTCTYHELQSYPSSRSYPIKGARVCPFK